MLMLVSLNDASPVDDIILFAERAKCSFCHWSGVAIMVEPDPVKG